MHFLSLRIHNQCAGAWTRCRAIFRIIQFKIEPRILLITRCIVSGCVANIQLIYFPVWIESHPLSCHSSAAHTFSPYGIAVAVAAADFTQFLWFFSLCVSFILSSFRFAIHFTCWKMHKWKSGVNKSLAHFPSFELKIQVTCWCCNRLSANIQQNAIAASAMAIAFYAIEWNEMNSFRTSKQMCSLVVHIPSFARCSHVNASVISCSAFWLVVSGITAISFIFPLPSAHTSDCWCSMHMFRSVPFQSILSKCYDMVCTREKHYNLCHSRDLWINIIIFVFCNHIMNAARQRYRHNCS